LGVVPRRSVLQHSSSMSAEVKIKSREYYKLIENIGPRHKPIFKVGVRLENSKFINGTGNSKKDAEQKAAALFLKNIKI